MRGGAVVRSGAVALRAVAVVVLAAASDDLPVAAQDTSAAEAVEAARRGGVVLVCRHAITGSFREREPVDYEDPTTQRRLSDEGERQSRAMGRGLRALGVDVTELVASPMQRARRTAALMFADRSVTIDRDWHTNGGDYGGAALERRARTLATPVERGVRLIVSHIGTMRSVLPLDGRSVGEGDCVVVRPGQEEGFALVGVAPWRAWTEAG